MNISTTTAFISERINVINESILINITKNEILAEENNILDAALSHLLRVSDDYETMHTSATTAIISERIDVINEAILLNIAKNEILAKEKDILDAALSQLLIVSDDYETPSKKPLTPCARTLPVKDAIDKVRANANHILGDMDRYTRSESRNVVHVPYLSIDYFINGLKACIGQLEHLNKELE